MTFVYETKSKGKILFGNRIINLSLLARIDLIWLDDLMRFLVWVLQTITEKCLSFDCLVFAVNFIYAASHWSFEFQLWKKIVNEAAACLRNCLIKSFWFIVLFLVSTGEKKKMFDNGECESNDPFKDKVVWTTCLLMIVATVRFEFPSFPLLCSSFFWFIYCLLKVDPGKPASLTWQRKLNEKEISLREFGLNLKEKIRLVILFASLS